MRIGFLLAIAAGVLLPRPGHAQAAKAPAVIRDSIYSMAVDSTKYPEAAFVYLLDDGVLRYEPSGVGTRTFRQVIQILKKDAVEQWAEYSISYQPDRERLVLNWARVVAPGGQVLSGAPEVSQDSDVPASMENPVYQQVKVKRLTLAKVAPGTLVDLSYTIEVLRPHLKGDFYTGWRITTGRPVIRSRLVLDTPTGYKPRVLEENLSFTPSVVDKGGRTVRTWAAANLPKIDAELFASDSNGVFQSVSVGGAITWEDIGAWYAGLARDRYAMTPALDATLHKLVAEARTFDDSLRAIHRYVARDVRYVAVSLGMGGYQPRAASAVSETGFGDCKDKATLFVTLARAIGLTAYPVLLHSSNKVDREVPSISQFDHAIAVVDRKGARMFVDLTASDVPYGLVPPNLDGQFVLVVEPDGTTHQATIPEPNPDQVASRMVIKGTVDSAGFFGGTIDMQLSGPSAAGLRAGLTAPYDSTVRRQSAMGLAATAYPGGQGDSLIILESGATGADPHVLVEMRRGRAAQLAGNAAILTLPFRQRELDFSETIRELRKKTPRRFPLDIAAMMGRGAREVRFELTLPPGWTAELPPPQSHVGWWGRFDTRMEQTGRTLVMVEQQVPAHGNLAPDRVEDVVKWLETAQTINQQYRTVAVVRKP